MLLALDTATTTISIAVYDLAVQRLLAESTWQANRRHTQDLLAGVQHLLGQVGLPPQQITALAVTTGPGSFTGVRIAISTAKGLGLGLATPPRVLGIPTLSVTAAPWLAMAGQTQPLATVCAYLQAGRGRYNWAYFGVDDLLQRPSAAAHVGGTAEEFAQALAHRSPEPCWLVGELDDALQHTIADLSHIVLVDAVSSWRRAGHLARLAALHFARGTQDDLHTLQPLYLRNP
jgi:tRNA threonylcarbamoyladenosine biosynthesis protein TsaB